MENIRAVIFDLDNTLIDRQRAFREMLKRKLPTLLADCDEAQVQEAINDVLTWDHNGTVSRLVSFTNLFRKYSVKASSPEELNEQWANETGTVAYLFEDVKETLDYLKPKYKLAILSNGQAESQRRKLATIDLYDYMTATLVSGEFEVDKPDAKIFRHIAAMVEEPVENCVYIGDNYQIDILGSQNAGMKSIFVDRHGLNPDTDVPVIHQIGELKELL